KILYKMGKLKDISFYDYISKVDQLEEHKPYLHVICMLLVPVAGLTTLLPGVGTYSLALLAATLAFNVIVYYRRKAKISIYFSVFSYLLRSLSFMEELSRLQVDEVSTYLAEIKGKVKQFKRFRRGAYLVVSKKISGSLEDVILDYVRMIFHVDLIKFDFMVAELKTKKEELTGLLELVGLLDSMIAVASFRAYLEGQYSLPILKEGSHQLLVDDIYHPLIKEPTKNSIQAKQSVLITGSNASGKSTFIKTVAINAILSQTIFTSLSSRYEADYFQIFSSMALRDNLFSNESYYVVEIKSLKRIYDQTSTKYPVLCFIDEVLRGTNTLERIAASSQILKQLTLRNALVFGATHDLELTNILSDYYDNYHFEEQIEGNDIHFDYTLRAGRAVSRNAIKLLSMIGYSEDIIDKATNEVNHFLLTNQWDKI
ncbi:MAG: hypothetical protein PWP24_1147, partial [Clostridiales bacterium]|nr:hypothetical protein [Clostridiales bacterium]